MQEENVLQQYKYAKLQTLQKSATLLPLFLKTRNIEKDINKISFKNGNSKTFM